MNTHLLRFQRMPFLVLIIIFCSASSLFGQVVRSCSSGGPIFYLSGENPFCSATIVPLRIMVEGVSGADVTPSSSLCNIADPSGTFSLAWEGNQFPSAVISVDQTDLYSTDSKMRADLLQAYRDFQQELVDLEDNPLLDCLVAGGARLISRRVAEELPLLLDEILLYRYGFDQTFNYLDLDPGMRLKVINTGFFNQDPNFDPTMTAFTGTGHGYITIGTQPGSADLAFNAFLSPLNLSVDMGTVGTIGNVRMTASVLDLAVGSEARRYARLFYPQSNSSFPAINMPNYQPLFNATIVRNSNFADWPDITMFMTGGAADQVCQQVAGRCAVFFGRATVIPEINVSINGNITWVPVGTTLVNIVERLRGWNSPATTPPAVLSGLLTRAGNAVVFTDTQPGSRSFEIPLIGGDRIDLDLQVASAP